MADESEIVALVNDALEQWATAREAVHFGESTGIALRCTAAVNTFRSGLPKALESVPSDLRHLWERFCALRLFEDQTFGQWGLLVYEPLVAIAVTQQWPRDAGDDYLHGDLIIGEFLGDGERLLVRNDASSQDYGSVIVSQPVYPRREWPVVAPSLATFFAALMEHQGAKYWER